MQTYKKTYSPCLLELIDCPRSITFPYVLVKLKLQHPPPRAYPGHLTVHRAWGGGNLNVALEGWGI